MCADGWYHPDKEVNGECPDCGTPTVDGMAQYGCNYSPEVCGTCGGGRCDESC